MEPTLDASVCKECKHHHLVLPSNDIFFVSGSLHCGAIPWSVIRKCKSIQVKKNYYDVALVFSNPSFVLSYGKDPDKIHLKNDLETISKVCKDLFYVNDSKKTMVAWDALVQCYYFSCDFDWPRIVAYEKDEKKIYIDFSTVKMTEMAYVKLLSSIAERVSRQEEKDRVLAERVNEIELKVDSMYYAFGQPGFEEAKDDWHKHTGTTTGEFPRA
jgi:hypothetical protein